MSLNILSILSDWLKNLSMSDDIYSKLEHIIRYYIYKIKSLPFEICKIIDSFNKYY